MIKIGLTGGIGSGKSTVAHVFEYMGVPVYYSDAEAKKLMQHSPSVRTAIMQTFGTNSYLSNGSIDKQYLAKVIFHNSQKRKQINSIVHPAVTEDFLSWSSAQKSKIVLFESALLFQTATKSVLDYIFAVSAKESSRIMRVIKRDGLDEKEVAQRIDSQMPQKKMDALADHVIFNEDDDLIVPQVAELIKKYKNGEIQ